MPSAQILWVPLCARATQGTPGTGWPVRTWMSAPWGATIAMRTLCARTLWGPFHACATSATAGRECGARTSMSVTMGVTVLLGGGTQLVGHATTTFSLDSVLPMGHQDQVGRSNGARLPFMQRTGKMPVRPAASAGGGPPQTECQKSATPTPSARMPWGPSHARATPGTLGMENRVWTLRNAPPEKAAVTSTLSAQIRWGRLSARATL
eukprot:1023850-Rhodomonas_salina.1